MKESDQKYVVAGQIFELLMIFLGVVVNFLLRGIVLSYLWMWFLTPIFNIPAPSIMACIAFGFTVHYIMHGVSKKSESKDEALWNSIFGGIFMHLAVLFVGWIMHFFV